MLRRISICLNYRVAVPIDVINNLSELLFTDTLFTLKKEVREYMKVDYGVARECGFYWEYAEDKLCYIDF